MDLFRLQGSYGCEPADAQPQSLNPSIATAIEELLGLTKKLDVDYALDADAPVSVAFGGLANAGVLVVKVENGRKVRVRVTSADGAIQAIPVSTFLVLVTGVGTPMTAIDLTRVAGIATTVRIFLGQMT